MLHQKFRDIFVYFENLSACVRAQKHGTNDHPQQPSPKVSFHGYAPRKMPYDSKARENSSLSPDMKFFIPDRQDGYLV
jgi:hypothetical protein